MRDPQVRAAEVLEAKGLREPYVSRIVAALAEAGLLAGPTGRACAICTKAANAARAELAEVKKQGLSLIAELQQVKAERDTAYQRGFTEGGEEALTSALHPEFGTEWREPDGIIWKGYQRGMVEGARQVADAVKKEADDWANDIGAVPGVNACRRVAREAVARIEGGHICGDHPAPCNHDPAHTEGGAT